MGYRILLTNSGIPYGMQTALQLSLLAMRNGLPREYGMRVAVGSATEDEALSLMLVLDKCGISYDVKESPEWDRK